jgi:hypothetical protein
LIGTSKNGKNKIDPQSKFEFIISYRDSIYEMINSNEDFVFENLNHLIVKDF